MLFMGTHKYPKEDYYRNFLQEHGGYSNAATGDSYTYYYFDVMGEKLPEALDIFSEFFKDPLFNEDAIKREM